MAKDWKENLQDLFQLPVAFDAEKSRNHSQEIELIPSKLSDWSYDSIKELTDRGYLETDRFDFKLEINSREPDYNKRLARTACAFANTIGGFIVFGVRDMGHSKAQLEGIERSDDLANDFGNKIGSVNPTVFFDFSNPPVGIPNSDKVLFVVEVPQSPQRPHLSDNIFYFRTNTGNEPMSYEQVREAFLRYDERRIRLNLLYMELLYNRRIAQKLEESTNTAYSSERHLSIYFDTTSIAGLLPEVYSVIQTSRTLVRDLFELRMQTQDVNSRIAILDRDRVVLPLVTMRSEITSHNDHLRGASAGILRLIDRIKETLEDEYDLSNPLQ